MRCARGNLRAARTETGNGTTKLWANSTSQFERIRSGEQIQIPTFTNVAAAARQASRPAKFPPA